MAKGYWIYGADVDDADTYQRYVAANAEAFRAHGARFLVRGGAFENPEGASRSRNVVLELPSYGAALECYRSPAYQKALAIRRPVARADIAICEGYDGPQPGASADDGAGTGKGYWIAHVDVDDAEAYKKYVAANAEPLGAYGARFLVRGGTSEHPEGRLRARHVVLAFPSYEAARDCYRSPGYQAAIALRTAASRGDVVIVRGYDGPQP
jgi:uncharacterized protein (DUF1330 family)